MKFRHPKCKKHKVRHTHHGQRHCDGIYTKDRNCVSKHELWKCSVAKQS